MKNRWIVFFVLATLISSVGIALAQTPWSVLSRSEGGIISAAAGETGQIMIQEEVRFIQVNPAGQSTTQNLPESQRIFISPSAGAYASLTYDGVPDRPETASLSVYRADGSTLWTLEHHPLNDIYPGNNGMAVGVARNNSAPENRVYFFSARGQLINEMVLPAVCEIRISPSDDRVLINSGTKGLLLFDDQGKSLGNLGSAYRWSFSADGRWVAVLYGPKVTLYHDGQATYTGEPSGEIVRGAALSPDKAHIAMFSDHALVVMENPSGKILLQQHLDPQEQFSFTSVDLTLNGACLAAGVERDLGESVQGPERHPDGQVRLYNLDGSLCYQTDITYRHWNTTTPRVSFSADGNQLLVLTRDEIRRAPLGSLCTKGGGK